MWGDCKQVPAMHQERGLTRHHTTSAHTMTLDFPASETSLCCLKPSGLRHFVIAGRMNQDNDPSVTPCSAHLNQTFTITFLQSYSPGVHVPGLCGVRGHRGQRRDGSVRACSNISWPQCPQRFPQEFKTQKEFERRAF